MRSESLCYLSKRLFTEVWAGVKWVTLNGTNVCHYQQKKKLEGNFSAAVEVNERKLRQETCLWYSWTRSQEQGKHFLGASELHLLFADDVVLFAWPSVLGWAWAASPGLGSSSIRAGWGVMELNWKSKISNLIFLWSWALGRVQEKQSLSWFRHLSVFQDRVRSWLRDLQHLVWKAFISECSSPKLTSC